ncbi:MAG: thermonuclease family protein [Capsulimonadales bacterium]|nr:thermonuclease family protein [Capsulimonadales bacterium]
MEPSRLPAIRTVLSILTLFSAFLSPVLVGDAFGQNRFSGRVVAIESGDTLRVRLDAFEMTVRLHGVECPVEPESLRDRARQYAARRVGETEVRVVVRGTAARQTVYADVFPASGESLNVEMIRVGLAAWAERYAPQRQDLAAAQAEAQTARRGMHGDPTGANVPLPARPSEVRRPTSAPSVRTPSRRVTTPLRTPTPVTSPSVRLIRPAVAPVPTATQRSGSGPSPVGLFIALLPLALCAITTVLFLTTGKRTAALPAQIAVAVAVTAGVTLLLPLPLLLLLGKVRAEPSVLLSAILSPSILLCLFAAFRLQYREQILRAVPHRKIADLPDEGLVRTAGRTSLIGAPAISRIGRIPGIYLREQTFRYEPISERPKAGYHWVPLHEETQAADFLLTDETGTIRVDGPRATYLPLRVARFYNELPVEKFFAEAYSGDLRTEILFLPAAANVTVWGRMYRTASPFPGAAERRLGFDPLHETLIVVEENPARAFTRRPIFSLFLTLVAVFQFLALLICLTSPETIAGWLRMVRS